MPPVTVGWWGSRGCSLLQTTAPSYEWKHWRWPCPLSKEPLMLMSTKKSIANSLKPQGNSSSFLFYNLTWVPHGNITCMTLNKFVLKIFVNTGMCKVSQMRYRRGQLNPPLDTAWAESTRKKALLKLEKLDTDLKNYKGNSIKESIRWGQTECLTFFLSVMLCLF